MPSTTSNIGTDNVVIITVNAILRESLSPHVYFGDHDYSRVGNDVTKNHTLSVLPFGPGTVQTYN